MISQVGVQREAPPGAVATLTRTARRRLREKARRLRTAAEGPAAAAEPAAARARSTSPRRAPAIGGARRSEDHPLRDRSPTPNADRAEGRDRRPEFDQNAPATEIREFDQNAPATEVRSDQPRNDRKGKGKGK